jgi:hypothetical protein
MQELDAERRAAMLRGITPPTLPEEEIYRDETGRPRPHKETDGHDRKRRRLAGEDDTDRDIRIASTVSGPVAYDHTAVLKLRKSTSEAPLTDDAGNINLFPIDIRDAMKCEKNAEAEKEKKTKERAMENQYTMRFSNAAGKDGLQRPWYASAASRPEDVAQHAMAMYRGLENRDGWGNDDPRRQQREQVRVATNDPLASMNRAQTQLKNLRDSRKKWVAERDQELGELRAVEGRESRGGKHGKRKKNAEEDHYRDAHRHGGEVSSSRHRHRHGTCSRSRSRDRQQHYKSSHRRERRHLRTSSHERGRHRELKSDSCFD